MQLRRLIARSALGDTLCGYVTCRQVLSVYKGHKWAFIEEHIHDVLGKQCRDTGNFDAALEHFAAMLNCPHSPPYWQSHYLKQFMDTIGAAGNAKVRHSMPMNTFLVHLQSSNQQPMCMFVGHLSLWERGLFMNTWKVWYRARCPSWSCHSRWWTQTMSQCSATMKYAMGIPSRERSPRSSGAPWKAPCCLVSTHSPFLSCH